MQIPSAPPPIVTNTLPQDVATKAVPVMQSLAPLVQNPVIPSAKSEKFNDKGGHKDRNRRDARPDSEEKGEQGEKGDRGNNLNIRV